MSAPESNFGFTGQTMQASNTCLPPGNLAVYPGRVRYFPAAS